MEESVLRRELVNTAADVRLGSQGTTARSTSTIASTHLVVIREPALTKWTTLSAPVSRPSLARLVSLSLTLAQLDLASTAALARLMATSTSSPAPAHLATRAPAVNLTSTNAPGLILAGTMGSV